ncbi:MAG: SAM-dependent chlorinase/fluorinase [Salinivirgaceae bacterium]|nr:SAM-dependent chlorinase/fluorinase [Salinivirgaceae bacterium]
MAIITLTSDWQNDDFYIGAIKGLIYSKCKDVRVIDITHKIDSFKYTQAAFVLKNVYAYYPEGTIHIVGINSDPTEEQPAICLKIKKQYFIGSSNGIFSLMFSEKPDEIVKIKESDIIKKSSFPELSMFAETAAILANGGTLSDIGEAYTGNSRHTQFMPVIDEGFITGNVIYVDSYQNIITNISSDIFSQVGKNRNFIITVKSDSYSIKKLSVGYSEVEIGEMLALFNSLDLLEIAMRNGRVAELLDIKVNSPVTIKFK